MPDIINPIPNAFIPSSPNFQASKPAAIPAITDNIKFLLFAIHFNQSGTFPSNNDGSIDGATAPLVPLLDVSDNTFISSNGVVCKSFLILDVLSLAFIKFFELFLLNNVIPNQAFAI